MRGAGKRGQSELAVSAVSGFAIRAPIAAPAHVAHNGRKSALVKVVQAAKVTPSSKLRAGGAGAACDAVAGACAAVSLRWRR